MQCESGRPCLIGKGVGDIGGFRGECFNGWLEGTLLKVRFLPKSDWQKDDCLYCEAPSTQEAVSITSRIRCCTGVSCMEEASKLAAKVDRWTGADKIPTKAKPKVTKLGLITEE